MEPQNELQRTMDMCPKQYGLKGFSLYFGNRIPVNMPFYFSEHKLGSMFVEMFGMLMPLVST